MEWILTDPDNLQFVQKVNENTFRVVEVLKQAENEEGLIVKNDFIDLELYPQKDIEESLQFFGYQNIKDVQEQYGESANQIIAECLSETSSLAEAQKVTTIKKEELTIKLKELYDIEYQPLSA